MSLMSNTTDILCFNCGSMFTVPFGTENLTKKCPTCKDKLEDELLDIIFGNK
jgi:phage FluMu protein Com